MAVKYRIEYCNKNNDTARLDIDVRDYVGQVQPIEGTGDLFILEYKRSDDYFLTTIADIQLFSDSNFNIDVLKTSDETELKALFYVNNILKWQGYILPDFFQTGIRGTDAISMTATDRLSVLKDIPMGYSREKLSYIQLITECLAKTGLSMNCNVVADFMLDGLPSTFHIMNCYVDHSRITNRNKSLSAYDVLRSVLVMLNAQIVQWAGEWWIVNRYQLRNGGGRVYNYTTSGTFNTSGTFTPASIPFGMVEANGRRSIEPVASQTSVFMEFGGVKRYPQDYEFRNYSGGYAGWTAVNSFSYTPSDKEVLSYNMSGGAIYGTRDIAPRMKNNNSNIDFNLFVNIPLTYNKYIKSTPVTNNIDGKIKVNVMLSATSMNKTFMPVLVVIDTKNADTSKRYYAYGRDGIVSLRATFATTEVNRSAFQLVTFRDNDVPDTSAINAVSNLNIELDPSDVGEQTLIGTDISLFIFGTGCDAFVNEASIGISNISDGKGVLYRTDQGAGGYSKKSDTDTTIFGDHLSQGINGFFYAYSQDELSIHSYLGQNIRTGWTSPNDVLVDPLLLHSVRQRARMNSKAKNILNVDFSTTFNPLAIYTCNATSYVVRSARHDFLRTRTSIELEENASQDLVKKDYVYTYFGDEKEKGISSLSGISVGSGGGGGTSHSHLNKDIIDQLSQVNLDVLALLEIDENDNLKVNTNLYSTGEVSAYGIGSSGGGGGTGSTVTWGAESAGAVPLEVEGVSKTLSLASHTHSGYLTEESDPTVEPHIKNITSGNIAEWTAAYTYAHAHPNMSVLNATTASFLTADRTKLDGIAAGANNYTHPATHAPSIIAQDANNRFVTDTNIATWNAKEPAIVKLTAFNKNFGTTAGTVSEGNHTHTFASLTSRPTTLSGYGITDALLASAYTAADVLTKLKTVDGHLSGLDADTVDGKHVTTSGWWDKLAYIGADGVMEVGAHIDFHEVSSGGADYAGRLSCYGGSPLWSGNAMYYALNANRTDVNWAAATLTAQTDILTPFNTWSNATDKNSLKKFLNLFDIDTSGNLVVKTNLYSTGGVTAYSSGTGVSGLTLMGDMNANVKNIINVGSISSYYGLELKTGSTTWFTLADDGTHTMLGEVEGLTSLSSVNLNASGKVTAPEFKFGNWTFKQDTSGRLGIYNGASEVACFNTDGTYVNL